MFLKHITLWLSPSKIAELFASQGAHCARTRSRSVSGIQRSLEISTVGNPNHFGGIQQMMVRDTLVQNSQSFLAR